MYKEDLTREWLESQNIKVYVNGVENTEKVVPNDDDTIEVFHYSKRFGWKKLKLVLNEVHHDKGIKKVVRYYNIGFTSKDGTHIFPYHRFLYAWFNGVAHKGFDISHLDDNGLNNNLSNLIEETRKANLARRGGAKNQYWKKQ